MTPEEIDRINDYSDFDGAHVKRMLRAAFNAGLEEAAKIAEVTVYNERPGSPAIARAIRARLSQKEDKEGR